MASPFLERWRDGAPTKGEVKGKAAGKSPLRALRD
jgi:hypothetical protein